jgi:hypothetical protein
METYLRQSQLQELSFEDMMRIDGGLKEGGFWHGFLAGLLTTLLIIALL